MWLTRSGAVYDNPVYQQQVTLLPRVLCIPASLETQDKYAFTLNWVHSSILAESQLLPTNHGRSSWESSKTAYRLQSQSAKTSRIIRRACVMQCTLFFHGSIDYFGLEGIPLHRRAPTSLYLEERKLLPTHAFCMTYWSANQVPSKSLSHDLRLDMVSDTLLLQ